MTPSDNPTAHLPSTSPAEVLARLAAVEEYRRLTEARGEAHEARLVALEARAGTGECRRCHGPLQTGPVNDGVEPYCTACADFRSTIRAEEGIRNRHDELRRRVEAVEARLERQDAAIRLLAAGADLTSAGEAAVLRALDAPTGDTPAAETGPGYKQARGALRRAAPAPPPRDIHVLRPGVASAAWGVENPYWCGQPHHPGAETDGDGWTYNPMDATCQRCLDALTAADGDAGEPKARQMTEAERQAMVRAVEEMTRAAQPTPAPPAGELPEAVDPSAVVPLPQALQDALDVMADSRVPAERWAEVTNALLRWYHTLPPAPRPALPPDAAETLRSAVHALEHADVPHNLRIPGGTVVDTVALAARLRALAEAVAP